MSDAPRNLTPGDGSVVDIQHAGVTFSWIASGFYIKDETAFKLMRTFAGGQQDWWTGSGFSATETIIQDPNNAQTCTIPPGYWGNGFRIVWSISTFSAHSAFYADSWGPYAGVAIYSATPPVTTVTTPSGPSRDARPVVQWTYSSAENTPQYGWEVQIVPYETYSVAGYDPSSFAGQTWLDSGVDASTATQVGVDLTNHKAYRAYVRTLSSPNPSGGLQFSAWSYTEFQLAIPPYAPTVTFPQNGSTVNLAVGFSLQWSDSYYQNDGAQTSFAVRRVIGTGAYQWWDGGTWQANEVFLANTGPVYAFRANEIANGVSYGISVAIQDAYGQRSTYSSSAVVLGSSTAQVTILGPPAVSVSTRPTVAWSMYEAEGFPQQTYQVRIISNSVYATGGAGIIPPPFDPLTVGAVWDSGEVADPSGATRSVLVPIDIHNASTQRTYVRVKTSNVYSGWSYEEFTVSLVAPAQPSATVTVLPDSASIRIDIQGRDSMLSDGASRSVADWAPLSNCTLAQGASYSGSSSGYITNMSSAASGTMSAHTGPSYPVVSGLEYTAAVSIIAQSGAPGVSAYASIEFFDLSNAVVSVKSAQVADDVTVIRSQISSVAPNGVVTARIRITAQSTDVPGRVHGFFDPVIRPNAGGEWSPGGLLGSTTISITENNDNRPLRHGLDIPVPPNSQQITIVDEEPALGRAQDYRMTARAVYPNAVLASIPNSAPPVTWTSGWLWLSDPLRAGSGRGFAVSKLAAVTRPARQGKFHPIGRRDAVFVNDVHSLPEGSFTLATNDRATREAYYSILENSGIVLLRIPPDTGGRLGGNGDLAGDTYYVQLEADTGEDRVFDSRTPHRVITQKWTAQLRPLDNLEYQVTV